MLFLIHALELHKTALGDQQNKRVLGGGLSFILYIVGLKNTTPAVASIVAMLEPVNISLFGVVVLNESLVGTQFFGMGLILYWALMDYGTMLKKTVGNLVRRSGHYRKQLRFEGSDCQLRGRILQVLLDRQTVVEGDLPELLGE